jgi:hypothetical protein
MADRMMFVGWGAPVRGIEERATEVFNETLGMLGRMQQDGRIESFDVCLLDPNADLGGYMQIHGTAEQIGALRMDDEFRRGMIDASLVVDDLRHIEGVTGEGVAREMEMYTQAISKIPQKTS